MFIQIVLDREPERLLGGRQFESLPTVGDIISVGSESAIIPLEVVETHFTSEKLSRLFSRDTHWVVCRSVGM